MRSIQKCCPFLLIFSKYKCCPEFPNYSSCILVNLFLSGRPLTRFACNSYGTKASSTDSNSTNFNKPQLKEELDRHGVSMQDIDKLLKILVNAERYGFDANRLLLGCMTYKISNEKKEYSKTSVKNSQRKQPSINI
jgi:hypothetical protein